MTHEQGLRLDKWLWFARLARSRSDAQELCASRRLRLDGRVVEKSSAVVRPGAVLSFPRRDAVIVVRVDALGDRRAPYDEARHLYTDLSPGSPPGPAVRGIAAEATQAARGGTIPLTGSTARV